MEPFVSVFGRIVKVEPPIPLSHTSHAWYCEELGGFYRNTGHLEDHVREICWDHGPAQIWDCIRGIRVNVGPPEPEWKKRLQTARYWIRTVVKFPGALVGRLRFALYLEKLIGGIKNE